MALKEIKNEYSIVFLVVGLQKPQNNVDNIFEKSSAEAKIEPKEQDQKKSFLKVRRNRQRSIKNGRRRK